jgi:hypothetical protein
VLGPQLVHLAALVDDLLPELVLVVFALRELLELGRDLGEVAAAQLQKLLERVFSRLRSQSTLTVPDITILVSSLTIK